MSIVRAACLAACLLPAGLAAQQNPFTAQQRMMYMGLKVWLVAAAEKMPAEDYSFRPTDLVRTFGQIIGHAADAQYRFCSIAAGQENPTPLIEKSKSGKAELVAALKEAIAYCDAIYQQMNDSIGAQAVQLDGRPFTRLGVLDVNNLHNAEHYGNLTTYLRLKNLVPPSSDPAFAAPVPKK